MKPELRLKAEFIPMTVMHLTQSDLKWLELQLQKKIIQAPFYLNEAPILVDVQGLLSEDELDMKAMYYLLKQYGGNPIGIRGLSTSGQARAKAVGFSVFNKRQEPNFGKTKMFSNALTVDHTIRSGKQVYAREADLIILGAVNAGGECIADGNIHVYGPLRGKAIAGAQGESSAQIFSQSLEAELISIAGFYLTSEKMQIPKETPHGVRIYLYNSNLKIEAI